MKVKASVVVLVGFCGYVEGTEQHDLPLSVDIEIPDDWQNFIGEHWRKQEKRSDGHVSVYPEDVVLSLDLPPEYFKV
jgi:hypothetical protein